MRLTLALMRKPPGRGKPLSYVREMYWNNHYYLNQERPVKVSTVQLPNLEHF